MNNSIVTSYTIEIKPEWIFCPMCEIAHENNTFCQYMGGNDDAIQ